jgi:hypothetical protein
MGLKYCPIFRTASIVEFKSVGTIEEGYVEDERLVTVSEESKGFYG